MSVQRKVRNTTNAAIFSRNYPTRLEEAVELGEVTHRASKVWRAAEVGVKKHGSMPLYYATRDREGMITHRGEITSIVIDPEPEDPEAERLEDLVSDDDTYSQHNSPPEGYARLDRTNYLVEDCRALEEPFHFTELHKLSDGTPLDEDYSYQPAYVYQHGTHPE
ncbi:YbaB/EbfC family nucleoid-associated protein [Haloterrigena alkaliphila]|uniref:YbaB/EbfC family nucleoid-associated protein n=1 Tax=Haloterrigena alkaliphila TaxID=2816475 RepID=A0A8A2V881_9EURY|nr:YbaB/EbfC family nucleoid-associated protein [Haloterrigena alkaliphila]QSW97651.1 YbaB/EbfC family nucleoid-associated protein [Haloterrigena alkaliphila]